MGSKRVCPEYAQSMPRGCPEYAQMFSAGSDPEPPELPGELSTGPPRIHLQGIPRITVQAEWRHSCLHDCGSSLRSEFHDLKTSMRRVCAEYAQIFFPGSAAGIPGTLASLGNLGSAIGIPWIAPGVSERICWTVQATESSSSVGRAQEDSTQRGGPRSFGTGVLWCRFFHLFYYTCSKVIFYK